MALPIYGLDAAAIRERLGMDDNIPDGEVAAILEDAQTAIEQHAPGAPEAAKRRGALIFAGALFERGYMLPETAVPSGYFRASGARAYLAPWHPVGAGIIRSGTALQGPPSAEELDERLERMERTSYLTWGPRGGRK